MEKKFYSIGHRGKWKHYANIKITVLSDHGQSPKIFSRKKIKRERSKLVRLFLPVTTTLV